MFTATTANTATTSTRLIKAMDRQHPVTISYVKEDGERTVRTIEIFDFTISKDGHVLILAMQRSNGERRSFRLDRITAYTIHRTRYLIERDETKLPSAPTLNHPGGPAVLLDCPTPAALGDHAAMTDLLANPVAVLADLLAD
ncbi:WYL domain-containing protein [Kitasatospora sp. NPDC097605]|uniref:WYL domain-containing protein n=1 Tax=Kitasatospora sp. NPDC097605 TaxID=3157226 RepID=UPI0033222E70